MGNDTGKGQHVWCWMTPGLTVRWLAHDEVAEWATEREARLAELRATIAADPNALFQLGHVHDTSNDMQAFLELPDCEACGGTGKDTHASPFEAPLAVHFAGPPVKAEGRQRQLCMWCGHVLSDLPSRKGGTPPPSFNAGTLVRVEDGLATEQPYDGGELPPGCCALPDDDEPVCPCDPETERCPKCADDQADDNEPVDPDDGYPVDLCGKHTGTCSNRCLLAAHHAGECDDDPRPDEAQETRAAADWPAEPVDTHADEQEADRA